MNLKSLISIGLMSLLCACSTGMIKDISLDEPSTNMGHLEERKYDITPDGEQALRVVPHIRSRDELLRYRESKMAEAAEILAMTEEASAEKPYYPAVITLKRPLSIDEFNKLLSNYNPSVQKALSAPGFSKAAHLSKAELTKGEDKIIASVIRFNSTTGKGQLHYETMADGEQLSRLEQGLAAKEKELNSIADYELVKGITNFVGGIHRDEVIKMFDDPRVFLADIGPIDLYQGEVQYAYWDDVSELVQKYLSHE